MLEYGTSRNITHIIILVFSSQKRIIEEKRKVVHFQSQDYKQITLPLARKPLEVSLNQISHSETIVAEKSNKHSYTRDHG